MTMALCLYLGHLPSYIFCLSLLYWSCCLRVPFNLVVSIIEIYIIFITLRFRILVFKPYTRFFFFMIAHAIKAWFRPPLIQTCQPSSAFFSHCHAIRSAIPEWTIPLLRLLLIVHFIPHDLAILLLYLRVSLVLLLDFLLNMHTVYSFEFILNPILTRHDNCFSPRIALLILQVWFPMIINLSFHPRVCSMLSLLEIIFYLACVMRFIPSIYIALINNHRIPFNLAGSHIDFWCGLMM